MTWPIMVLKAKETIVAMETPLERVWVSKISAGMMKERGPQVAEKEMLYSQVLFGCGLARKTTARSGLMSRGRVIKRPIFSSSSTYQTMKPQPAELEVVPNNAMRIVAIMKKSALKRFPPISAHLRPTLSMNKTQDAWASRARMLLIA